MGDGTHGGDQDGQSGDERDGTHRAGKLVGRTQSESVRYQATRQGPEGNQAQPQQLVDARHATEHVGGDELLPQGDGDDIPQCGCEAIDGQENPERRRVRAAPNPHESNDIGGKPAQQSRQSTDALDDTRVDEPAQHASERC